MPNFLIIIIIIIIIITGIMGFGQSLPFKTISMFHTPEPVIIIIIK